MRKIWSISRTGNPGALSSFYETFFFRYWKGLLTFAFHSNQPVLVSVFTEHPKIPNQFIAEINGVSLFLKREDRLHPTVSGNKFRKLKYNVEEAVSRGHDTLLTFGGAYSNHIAATAEVGRISNLKTIGIIRGEELGQNLSHTLEKNRTLQFAASSGMQLEFISRTAYREKHSEEQLEQFRKTYGNYYLLPEGGTNSLAIRGCEEILTQADREFDLVCCAVGTGGTISGIINSSGKHQKVLGFPALKGNFLSDEVEQWTQKDNWEIIENYHFGGYGRVNRELIAFMNTFSKTYGIQLDPIYTGKLLFGIFDLIKKRHFSKNTRILAIHTGGLQGISGMNSKLKSKDLPQINIIA